MFFVHLLQDISVSICSCIGIMIARKKKSKIYLLITAVNTIHTVHIQKKGGEM